MLASRLTAKVALILALASLAAPAAAQYATLDWALGIGSSGNEFANGIAVDGSGNVYVTGQFTNTADFDPGAGAASLASAGNTDGFVAKYDATGAYQWAFAIGGTGYDYGYAIALDGAGNLYVAGQFAATVDFDPGAGTTTRTAAAADGYVAKYDTAGAFSWVASFGGSSNDRARAVAAGAGVVFVAGEFMGSNVDFDPGAGTALRTSAGSQDVFLVRLDGTGAFQWVQTIGSTGSDVAYGVARGVISPNVYVTGQFAATVDFDPGAGTASRTSGGGSDAFVWAVGESAGGFAWAAAAGSTGGDVGYALAEDGSGNVLATGYFNGTVDFDPDAGTSNLVSAGGTDLFVWKLTSEGALTWARRLGAAGADIGSAIALDASGNPHVAGQFAGTICEPATTSAGQSDALLAKWLADGTQVSLNGMGGTGFDDGRAIAINGSVLAVAGSFEATADFDPGAPTSNLASAGGRDLFVTRYSALPSTAPAAPEIAVLQGATPIPDGTATAVDFGTTTVGSPVSLVFTIDNTAGAASLAVANLTLAGNPLPSGGYSNPGGFPASVAAGATAAFTVQLDAAAPGTFSGTLQFTSTDCDESPYDFPITGSVLASPEAAVFVGPTPLPDGSLTPYGLGDTLPGVPLDTVFTIDNTAGSATLTVANLRLDGSPLPIGGFSNPGGFPASVLAGSTATFVIRLVRTTAGLYGGTIEFDTNDSDENPYSFVIAGQVNEAIPALSLPGLAALTLLLAAVGVALLCRSRVV